MRQLETILVISILISTIILGTYLMYQINTVNYYQIIKQSQYETDRGPNEDINTK